MSPADLPLSLWVLLGSMALVLLLVWIGQWRLGARLARIEGLLTAAPQPAELEDQKASNKEQKRLFQIFLDEDPRRAELLKKEQFAEFRKWRNEQGLNWGKEDS